MAFYQINQMISNDDNSNNNNNNDDDDAIIHLNRRVYDKSKKFNKINRIIEKSDRIKKFNNNNNYNYNCRHHRHHSNNNHHNHHHHSSSSNNNNNNNSYYHQYHPQLQYRRCRNSNNNNNKINNNGESSILSTLNLLQNHHYAGGYLPYYLLLLIFYCLCVMIESTTIIDSNLLVNNNNNNYNYNNNRSTTNSQNNNNNNFIKNIQFYEIVRNSNSSSTNNLNNNKNNNNNIISNINNNVAMANGESNLDNRTVTIIASVNTYDKNNTNIITTTAAANASATANASTNTTANASLSASASATYIQPRKIRDASSLTDEDEYDYMHNDDEELDEYELLIRNKSAKGKYIGAPCDFSCDSTLHHVFCDPATFTCGCERNYPVVLGLIKGCAKPKKLGEQCFYHQTCIYNDENSLCVQVSHNARCECADGFHSVSYTKPTKRVFCTQDLAKLTSNLPTLLGVSTGIAVLAGLICMVLHLFSKTKYPRHRNFADANIPPPIMYSSDTGIPLTVQSGRPSSRSSLRSTSGSIGSYGNRRPSSAPHPGSKGVLVSTSRTGSRRPSLASVHSTSSSIRSYSAVRFEKEIQQKEIRYEMKLRLARLQQQQQLNQMKPQIVVGETISMHGAVSKVIPTPSPLTPNSTDELLPAVDESQEEFSPKMEKRNAAYTGPCTSSSEAL